MTFRNVGRVHRQYTTTQIAALVTKFGPSGTQEANAIAPGTIVFDTSVGALKLFNGTAWLTITAA